ncbi:MAG: insulinase family protein [Planctomycetes bacterium]|nr:insulinase family protein [Planctomycetota bacterium]
MESASVRSALALAAALSALSAAAGAQEVEYEKYRLENGLTVILHEDHRLPAVAVNLWCRVGSKDEEPGRSGFAHLFEHLMFMGTERAPESDFDRIMEAGGGWNNATTSEDRTNYFSSGPANLLPTLLWLEADRLEALGKAMTSEKLDLQRDVVRNERRESDEMRPYGKADLLVTELMFPDGHPYHNPVIGSHEDLAAASVEDVKAFFERWYAPNNFSLVVAGDFDPAATKERIAELFGGLAARPIGQRRRIERVKLERTIRATVEDDVEYARATLVYHSPAHFERGDAEMDVVAELLASGIASRLYKRLIYEEKLAAEVSAYQSSMEDGSLFFIEAYANEGVELARIEKAIDEEMARLAERGPTKRELERIANRIETRIVSELQSIEAKADRLSLYEAYLGEPGSFRFDLARYRKVDSEGIRKWTDRVLVRSHRLELHVLPRREPPVESPIDRRPGFGDERLFEPPAPESFALSNGIPVHLFSRRDLPLVSLGLFLAGGALLDPAGKDGLAKSTADMLEEGSGALGALAWSEEMALLGATFGTSVGTEHNYVELSCLKRNLGRALALFRTAVLEPRFEPKEWERVRDLAVVELRQDREDPTEVARLVAIRRFFGDSHPYGRPAKGTPESLGGIVPGDLAAFHEGLYRPGNATLLVAGDLDAKEARELLEEAFGKWVGPESPPPPSPAVLPPILGGTRVYLVHEPDAVQTVIRWVLPAPPRSTPDRVGLYLLNTLFGGSFTSRLNANLREDKGYTYGASSDFVLLPKTGYLLVSTSVRADATGASLAEIAKEFAAVAAGTISAGEAEKARRTYRTEAVGEFSTLDSILSNAVGLLAGGQPLADAAADLAKSGEYDAGKLNELSARALLTKDSVLVLVGDGDRVLPQLEGLGLPEPVLCDSTGGILK